MSSFEVPKVGAPDLRASTLMGGSGGGKGLVDEGRGETRRLFRGEVGGGRRGGGREGIQLGFPGTIHCIRQILLPQPQLD